MSRFDLGEFGKSLGPATEGDYEIRKSADGVYTLVAGGGGPSTDVRPLIEQAKSRIFVGYTDRDPLTRIMVGTRSALETRRFTLPDGSTILETFDRPDGNILTRRFYEGQYITDLLAANNISGNALIRTYIRPTGPNGLADEWRFGFIAALVLILTENGLLEEDPSNSPLATLTENGLLSVDQGYELTENGLLREIT